MQSVEISDKVCQTTGGGKIVDIPGFPGEKIDRRLLNDIKYLRRKYKIFITDGYSTNPVHSANGEHPRGLALDIVPNFAAGGDWNDIDRLAKMAEPSQNQPRSPFRWVGYNGDSGHGRGHHLHLSYSHSGSAFGKPEDRLLRQLPEAARRRGRRSRPTRRRRWRHRRRRQRGRRGGRRGRRWHGGGGDGGGGGKAAAFPRAPSTRPSPHRSHPRPQASTASATPFFGHGPCGPAFEGGFPGVPVVAGSGQAYPRRLLTTA